MRDHDSPTTFAKEEDRPWQAWLDTLLHSIRRRRVPATFPGLTRPVGRKEAPAFFHFLQHVTRSTVADPTGGDLWHAAFQALPPPRSAQDADRLWDDALECDSQALTALVGALGTAWAPTQWPQETPTHTLGVPAAKWAYQALDRFRHQALILGWGKGEPVPESLLYPWARLLNGIDERLGQVPVEQSAWRLLARQAWWSMAAGFPTHAVWHQGPLSTPDLGAPRDMGGAGLQHVGLLDAPVLDPMVSVTKPLWRSLGTQLFDQASAFHLGKGLLHAFTNIPECMPTWFQVVRELRQAHRDEGEDRFVDPQFQQALQHWTAEVIRRGRKGSMPEEYEAGQPRTDRAEGWSRVVAQAPLLWQARFRQWTSEGLVPAGLLPPAKRARWRS